MSDDNTEARATPTDNTPQDGQGRLDQLVKRASAKDAVKDFDAAAELYSQATELQTQLNGELSPDNADLLFAYGKSLYNVAVSKSDVLGSKVAGPPESSGPSAGNAASTASSAAGGNTIQNAMASGMAKKAEDDREKSQSEAVQNKPYFQFTGDENFDEEDEEDNDGAAGEEEEDDDDFANAFEVLDLARVLYHKKLGAAEEGLEKGKSTGMPADIKLIKEHLADTHDLQAEISLEAERFSDAVADLRTVLELRQSLFPFEDSLLAEAHYKLSLALEFASVHKQGEGAGEGNSSPDDGMRKEAVTHMERAIESCRIRISQAQRNLDDNLSTMDEDKVSAAKMKIANVKDIVGDMEQRLIDLRQPPISIKEQNQNDEAVLKGVLGQIVGQSPSEQKSRLDAVSKGANDLSAFVKRKPASSRPQQGDPTPKRSASEAQDGDAKRARMDEPSHP